MYLLIHSGSDMLQLKPGIGELENKQFEAGHLMAVVDMGQKLFKDCSGGDWQPIELVECADGADAGIDGIDAFDIGANVSGNESGNWVEPAPAEACVKCGQPYTFTEVTAIAETGTNTTCRICGFIHHKPYPFAAGGGGIGGSAVDVGGGGSLGSGDIGLAAWRHCAEPADAIGAGDGVVGD